MNKIRYSSFLFPFIFVLLVGGLQAQNESRLPLPKVPFVQSAPAYAAWTVMYTPKQSKAPGEAASPPPTGGTVPSFRRLKEVKITKTPDLRREVSEWSDGSTTEAWMYKDLILSTVVGQSEVFVISRSSIDSRISQFYPDYSQSDFPGLDWLALGKYVGADKYNDRLCYYFYFAAPEEDLKQRIPGKQIDLERKAWIDAKTLLPVAIDTGFDLQVYMFSDSAPESLNMPPKFVEALADYQINANEPNKHRMKP